MTTAAGTTAPPPPASAADVRRVVVLGAGQMGSGIAQVFATSGRTVALVDIDEAGLERARTTIARSAGKLHEKGVLSDDQAAAVEQGIEFVRDARAAAADADLAIEAIVEDEHHKRTAFAMLDEALPERAVLATNTSSISVTTLAAATSRPDRVVGMHFMNPVPVLELVEVIPGLTTAGEVTTLVCDLARELGKQPVLSADSPGFITNRVLMPLINEAFFCLHENVGTAAAIDDAMRLGMRHPMGPLALADLIGLDTCLSILEVLHRDLGDDKYRPCPLLRRYVAAGRLGRKSGAGVHEYAAR